MRCSFSCPIFELLCALSLTYDRKERHNLLLHKKGKKSRYIFNGKMRLLNNEVLISRLQTHENISPKYYDRPRQARLVSSLGPPWFQLQAISFSSPLASALIRLQEVKQSSQTLQAKLDVRRKKVASPPGSSLKAGPRAAVGQTAST